MWQWLSVKLCVLHVCVIERNDVGRCCVGQGWKVGHEASNSLFAPSKPIEVKCVLCMQRELVCIHWPILFPMGGLLSSMSMKDYWWLHCSIGKVQRREVCLGLNRVRLINADESRKLNRASVHEGSGAANCCSYWPLTMVVHLPPQSRRLQLEELGEI